MKKDKENETSDLSIENTKWIISTLDNDVVKNEHKNSRTIHFILEAETNKVTGFSGCNTFMGSYKIDGNKISFSQIASTRMMCLDETVNETDVLNVFNSANNFNITNGELSLNNSSETTLAKFKKAENFENQIVEKYWKLKKINGKEIKISGNQEIEIFFILKTQNNRITGFAGCNNIIGEYVLENENKISFKNVSRT
jgi:heat shock protein HslJ